MSVLLEINRDFPYQVALSFDEAAMHVLEWLEECDFEWDMYVDLPENTVRYCFRTVGDAAAFERRFGHAAQGRASRRRPLTGTGPMKSSCRRASAKAAGTKRFTSSAQSSDLWPT